MRPGDRVTFQGEPGTLTEVKPPMCCVRLDSSAAEFAAFDMNYIGRIVRLSDVRPIAPKAAPPRHVTLTALRPIAPGFRARNVPPLVARRGRVYDAPAGPEEVARKPVKPVLRYFGGKWQLADWVIDHIPAHRIYVEPYGGAASVLLQKDRSFSETINDMDSEIVNLFRVLQDRSAFAELEHRLKYTPYSRDEFEAAYIQTDDPIERARRVMIRSWMGHSTVGTHRRTGYRTNVRYVRRSAPAGDWQRLVDHIGLVVDRLRGVNIENRPAIEVIQGHDTPDTFFYVDPPYPFSTRHGKVYTYEMSDDEHRELAKVLQSVKGMVVVSGYACDLYDLELYPNWQRLERLAYADKGLERTEVLWVNPAAQKALGRSVRQHDMFERTEPRTQPHPAPWEGAGHERAESARGAEV